MERAQAIEKREKLLGQILARMSVDQDKQVKLTCSNISGFISVF